MKILLVGDHIRYGWAETFARAFRSLGHDAVVVDEWGMYRAATPLAGNRYIHRLGWRFLARPFQRRFLDAVVEHTPDLVIVFKGWLIMPDTLATLRQRLPKVVLFNYNPDNPFNTWHHGNSNDWIRKSIPLYDAYFIWGEFLREPILDAGAQRFEYLLCAYDPNIHHPVACSPEELPIFSSDIAFIGSWDEEREAWLRHICDFDIKIWGNSWKKAGSLVRSRWQGREVTMDDFAKVCGTAKIILNFVRRQNGSAHNMRTFEVPACGGFVLSTRTPEQEALFVEGKEIVLFSTPRELREKINYYLLHDAERRSIAATAYAKVTSGGNTYRDRAQRVLQVYHEIAHSA